MKTIAELSQDSPRVASQLDTYRKMLSQPEILRAAHAPTSRQGMNITDLPKDFQAKLLAMVEAEAKQALAKYEMWHTARINSRDLPENQTASEKMWLMEFGFRRQVLDSLTAILAK